MSVALRIILVIASILTFIYVVRKLRKSQVQLMDTVFWFFLTLVFVIFAVFPELVNWFSVRMGFMAPVNFVFLVMIFLLIIRCFLLSLRVSQLDDKLKNIVEEIAIREHDNQKKE